MKDISTFLSEVAESRRVAQAAQRAGFVPLQASYFPKHSKSRSSIASSSRPSSPGLDWPPVRPASACPPVSARRSSTGLPATEIMLTGSLKPAKSRPSYRLKSTCGLPDSRSYTSPAMILPGSAVCTSPPTAGGMSSSSMWRDYRHSEVTLACVSTLATLFWFRLHVRLLESNWFTPTRVRCPFRPTGFARPQASAEAHF